MRKEEQAALARRLLRPPKGVAIKLRQEEGDTLYAYEACRGGGALLIDTEGQVLFADSSISYEEHLQAFREGIRTPLSDFE